MKNKMILPLTAFLLLTGCSSSMTAATGYDNDTLKEVSVENAGAYSYDSYADRELPETQESSEKLVYSGSLSIETKTYEDTVSFLRNKVEAYGGMIENEEEYSGGYDYYGSLSDDSRNLSMTVRIPSGSFYEFIDEAEGTCVVTLKRTSVENITQSYNDTEITLEALEKQEQMLLDMMDQAQTIDEMISVESRLTEVQTELSQIQYQLNSMDTDIAYSALNISVSEVVTYSESKTSFLQDVHDAFLEGFASFGDTVRGLVLLVIYLIPYLLVLALIIFLLKKIKFKLPFSKKKKQKEKDHTIV